MKNRGARSDRSPLSTAILCGLLVNERLSNALKQAFPGAPGGGRCGMGLRALAGDEAMLTVCDDGVGLPEGIVLGQAASLGLRFAPLLAQKLQGTLTSGRGAPPFPACHPQYRPPDPVLALKYRPR
ncbi:MAG: hypothetical protein M3461_08485 [Pseudomonadota bacterium]|nr:hypothetical protein [Pseudomonadota bacterium]